MQPFESAGILWRMSYIYNASNFGKDDFFVVHSKNLENNKIREYRSMLLHLKLSTKLIDKCLSGIESNINNEVRNANSVHDWKRSIAHTNNYWKDSLSEQEIDFIRHLTCDVETLYDQFITN